MTCLPIFLIVDRYRRSIDFLVPFKLVTKLVFWDERSLYFEQRFVSLHDGFVRAVALCKNTCVGGTVTVRWGKIFKKYP